MRIEGGIGYKDGNNITIDSINAQFFIDENSLGHIVKNSLIIKNPGLNYVEDDEIIIDPISFRLNQDLDGIESDTLERGSNYYDGVVGNYTNQPTITNGNGTGLLVDYKIFGLHKISENGNVTVTDLDNSLGYKYSIEKNNGSADGWNASGRGTTRITGDCKLSFKAVISTNTSDLSVIGLSRFSALTDGNNYIHHDFILQMT